MNLKEEEILRYDPHHIISQRRLQNKNVPFEHQEVEGLEKLENLENLEVQITIFFNKGQNSKNDEV